MSENVSLVVTATPNPDETQATQDYLQQALPMLLSAGGEILFRGKVTETLVGPSDYAAAMVMQFPSADAARSVFASDEYAAIVPLRERGFKAMSITIAEA